MKNGLIKAITLVTGIGLIGACGVVQNPRQIKYFYVSSNQVGTETQTGQQNSYNIKDVASSEDSSIYRFEVEWAK